MAVEWRAVTGDPESFVGRAPEVSDLSDVIVGARAGRGGSVLVLGEAGVGKTTLVRHVVGRCGVRAWWAVAREDVGAPPLWLWDQLAREAAADGDDAVSRAVHAVEPGADSSTGRFRHFDGVVAAVAEAAHREPLVIVIDDLHWADDDSLDLLEFLVPDLVHLPVAVVTTARPAELVGAPKSTVTLELSGLAAADLRRLISDMAGTAVDDVVAAAARDQTGGNPFLVTEVTRLLRATGGVGDPERWTNAVPDGVKAVVARRLARLPHDTASLVVAASVLDCSVEMTVLAGLVQRDRSDVVAVLEPAVSAGLLRDVGGDTVEFAHALVRDAARAQLGPSEQVRLHRRAAEIVSVLHGERAAPIVAGHHLAAGDDEALVEWAERAGDAAAAMGMHADAARWYGRVVDHLPSVSASLLVRLGDARSRSGQLSAADDAYRSAVEQARSEGDAVHLALAVLGIGTVGGTFEIRQLTPSQEALIDEALATVGDRLPVLRSLLLSRLSVASTLDGDHAVRSAQADEAVATARDAGDPAALATALGAWCDAHAGPSDNAARLVVAAEMLDAARASGDPELELLARRNLIVAAMERGRIGIARIHISAFVGLADRLRQPRFRWYARVLEGMTALLDGDLDRADAMGVEAEREGQVAESANAEMLARGALRAMVARARGDLDAMRSFLVINEAHAEASRGFHLLVLLTVGHGPDPAAVARSVATSPPPSDWPDHDSIYLLMLTAHADAFAFIGDEVRAADLEQRLLPHADLFVLDGMASVCYHPVVANLARLALVRGDREVALSRYDRAIDLVEAMDAPGLATPLRAERARVAAGEPWDEAGMAAGPATPDARGPDVVPSPTPGVVASGRFRCVGDVWEIEWRGASATLAHRKGLGDIAILLGRVGREVHVLDLVTAADGASTGPTPVPTRDLGPTLDQRARSDYELRIRDLTDDIEEAERNNDIGRAQRLDDERAVLLGELAGALGLGGRDRVRGSDAERARKAVGMRVADAILRIDHAIPDLGRHLRHSIRTGTFCEYRPEISVHWDS